MDVISKMNIEINTIPAFFITGILIGILFDIFRISRKTFKTPNIVIYIEDILFWVLTGVLILFTIFTFTTGEIRLYMIVILILGAILYFLSISKYFIKINVKILKYIKSIISFCIKPIIKLTDLINFNKFKKIFKK